MARRGQDYGSDPLAGHTGYSDEVDGVEMTPTGRNKVGGYSDDMDIRESFDDEGFQERDMMLRTRLPTCFYFRRKSLLFGLLIVVIAVIVAVVVMGGGKGNKAQQRKRGRIRKQLNAAVRLPSACA